MLLKWFRCCIPVQKKNFNMQTSVPPKQGNHFVVILNTEIGLNTNVNNISKNNGSISKSIRLTQSSEFRSNNKKQRSRCKISNSKKVDDTDTFELTSGKDQTIDEIVVKETQNFMEKYDKLVSKKNIKIHETPDKSIQLKREDIECENRSSEKKRSSPKAKGLKKSKISRASEHGTKKTEKHTNDTTKEEVDTERKTRKRRRKNHRDESGKSPSKSKNKIRSSKFLVLKS